MQVHWYARWLLSKRTVRKANEGGFAKFYEDAPYFWASSRKRTGYAPGQFRCCLHAVEDA